MMAFRYLPPLLSPGDASPVYEEVSPVLKVTRGSFHHHHFGGGVVCLGGLQNGYHKIQGLASPHKNPQHTLHNTKMSRRRPTLQLLCTLSPWQQQPQPRLLVPPLPMDPGQVRGAWLLLAVLVGSHLGHQNKPHQKIERKMVHWS
jgi:hypothetical protein